MNSTSPVHVRGFSGGGNLPLTLSLLQDRRQMNGVELIAVARHLKEIRRYRFFQDLFDDFRSVEPNSFWPVWGAPAAFLWTRLVLQSLQHERQASQLVKNHSAWLGKTFEQFLDDHLKQLGIFIVAAKLREGKAYRLPMPVPVDALGAFPSTGIAWQAPVPFTLLGCTAEREVLANLNSLKTVFPIAPEPVECSSFFQIPKSEGCGILWIDAWDTCSRLDYAGMEWIPRITTYPGVQEAAHRVNGALSRIMAYQPRIAEEVGFVLSLATPLQSLSSQTSHSGSVSFLPGAFGFANLPDEDRIAEMILHEFSHNKLFLLDNRDPLLDQAQHGDGWRDEFYYSPWRDEPRPLKGILHGVFVFVEVAAFWANRLEDVVGLAGESVAVRRFRTVFSQVDKACEVLQSNAHFTAVGSLLFDDLRDRLDSLRGFAQRIDTRTISPLYAELQKDGRYGGLSLDEAIRRHFHDVVCVGAPAS